VRSRRATVVATILLVIAGCAPELVTVPTTLMATNPPLQRRSVANAAGAESSAGYARTLFPGTLLESVGRIPEGDVWRPLNLTLTVEGASIHEAYVVTSGDRWTGFYLPVERSFSPLKQAVPITLEAR
jgi:hypothetical protein